jgi:GNAT superfamily N-acetyltransferase
MIRHATLEDLPRILDLAQVMHMESRFKDIPHSREKVELIFTRLIEGAGLILVAEKNGKVIGAIAAAVIELWFSTGKVGQDFGLFIHPEHRGGMLAARLVKGYEDWAKSQGAHAAELGINTGLQLEKTGQLLAHLGYTTVATLHAKEF